MKIAGIIKNSFVDYPSLITAVVFTQGCNYDCFFCHNRALIPFDGEQIDEDEVFDFLEKRVGLLDGVVISGGEPTLQADLKDFIIKIKELGFLVKLDTNGSRVDILQDLINSDLLDYIAMDYKAPFSRYDEVCCTKCDIQSVKKSIEIIRNSEVAYELRTTFLPQLTAGDIKIMLGEIPQIDTFSIQHYKTPEEYKKEHRSMLEPNLDTELEIEKARDIAEKFVKNVIIR